MENKKYTLRFRAVNKDIFLAIKNSKKRIETRAATERYRNIKAGDIFVFVCGKERFQKRVKRAIIFRTIPAMLRKYKVSEINPFLRTPKELTEKYWSFPGYREKIRKYGLMAIEL